MFSKVDGTHMNVSGQCSQQWLQNILSETLLAIRKWYIEKQSQNMLTGSTDPGTRNMKILTKTLSQMCKPWMWNQCRSAEVVALLQARLPPSHTFRVSIPDTLQQICISFFSTSYSNSVTGRQLHSNL